MKVLVVGGVGREHALAAALERSGAELYSAMRHNNPGIARLAKQVRHLSETGVCSTFEFARAAGVDIAVMGPEAPLEAGLVDALEAEGIGCVGPTKAAARLETSKSFARELMQRYGVPGNLRFASFDDLDEAKEY